MPSFLIILERETSDYESNTRIFVKLRLVSKILFLLMKAAYDPSRVRMPKYRL